MTYNAFGGTLNLAQSNPIGHVASLLRGSWRLLDHLDMSRWSGVSLTSQ